MYLHNAYLLHPTVDYLFVCATSSYYDLNSCIESCSYLICQSAGNACCPNDVSNYQGSSSGYRGNSNDHNWQPLLPYVACCDTEDLVDEMIVTLHELTLSFGPSFTTLCTYIVLCYVLTIINNDKVE